VGHQVWSSRGSERNTETGNSANPVRRDGHLLDHVQPPQRTLNLPPCRLHHGELGDRQGSWFPDAAFQVGDLCLEGGVLLGQAGVALLEGFLRWGAGLSADADASPERENHATTAREEFAVQEGFVIQCGR
jgi:hypothetical protein